MKLGYINNTKDCRDNNIIGRCYLTVGKQKHTLTYQIQGVKKIISKCHYKRSRKKRLHSPLCINFTSDKLSIINTYEQKTISLPFLYSQSRWCYNIEVTNHTDPHGSQGEFPYPEHQCIDLVRSAITLDCDFDQKTSNLRKNILLLDYVSVCAFVRLFVCLFDQSFVRAFVRLLLLLLKLLLLLLFTHFS